MATLSAAHLYALPKPAISDPALEAALVGLRGRADRDRWLAVHVLYAQCRCSARIVEHLAASRRPARGRVGETLLLVGDASDLRASVDRITARGIRVLATTAEQLRDRFHVEAAPLLLVVSPGGQVRYSGGYSDRKQSLALRDRDIIEELTAGGSAPELPLLGCAVSEQLQRLLDPLALRAPRSR